MQKVTKKISKNKRKASLNSELPSPYGILYIAHLPYGFEEEEIKTFLNQYGKVLKLKLCRSKKTRRSKGYAFVLFEDEEVAKEVEKSLEDYFMFGQKLKVKLMDKDKYIKVFEGNTGKFRFKPFSKIHKNKFNAEKDAATIKLGIANLLNKDEEKYKKLKELGINYDFPKYSDLINN